MAEFKNWTIGEFHGYFLVMEPGDVDWVQFPFSSIKEARRFIGWPPLVQLLKLLLGQINEADRRIVNLGRVRDWIENNDNEVPDDLMSYFSQQERKVIIRSILTTTGMNLTGAT